MIRMMVGRELSDLFPKTPAQPGDEVLRVRNISLQHAGACRRFCGAGRVVRSAARRGAGHFRFDGRGPDGVAANHFRPASENFDGRNRDRRQAAWRIKSPEDAIAAGLALAPEDRKAEGVVLGLSVAHNTTLSCLPQDRAAWVCCSRDWSASWWAITWRGCA